mgnify:CR=1 FL=1
MRTLQELRPTLIHGPTADLSRVCNAHHGRLLGHNPAKCAHPLASFAKITSYILACAPTLFVEAGVEVAVER